MLRSNLELLSYKTSMSCCCGAMCGAALDISTEELCTNSAKLRKFPGLYESVPLNYRGIGPQISVLTEQFFLLPY